MTDTQPPVIPFQARPGERLGVLPGPRPDYAQIDRLERELGRVEDERRPIKRPNLVCLTKNCQGDTRTVETWSGQLLYSVHRCEG